MPSLPHIKPSHISPQKNSAKILKRKDPLRTKRDYSHKNVGLAEKFYKF